MERLARLNERLHAAMEDDLLRVLEALTALDLDGASRGFEAVARALDAHAAAEDAHALPLYAGLGPFPRGADPKVFHGDHLVILRSIRACRRQLEAWQRRTFPEHCWGEGGLDRRSMILGLDPFMRLRHVLEHHGLREERHLYPALDDALSAEDRARLGEALRAAYDPAP
ncbi:MAG: hemerythrin domain-containing protein [Myxococcota bacterium]